MAALKSLFALALFALSANAAGTLLPEGWSVLDACAVDVPSRLLKSVKIKNLDNNTPQDCAYYCDSLGYSYAGVEYGMECHCGRGYDTVAATSAPASDCNMPCTGDSSQRCGAGWRIQVFVTNSKLPASPVIPDGWSTAYGCAIDTGDRVLLHNKMYTLPKSNSPAACVQKCASIGMTHAGVEYGSECHCGDGYLWQPASAPIEQCDMDCTGNSYYNCGSGNRISIYTLDSPSASTTSSSTTTSATSAPTASSVAVSGNIGVYNKTSNQLIGYITPVNGGKSYMLDSDQNKALNVQFKFSTMPNTPFSIRVTDDSPYGYLGVVQPSNHGDQCTWCGEWLDEVVNVAYSKPGKALTVGNGYDDIFGGKHASQATMWLIDPRTRVIEGIWTNPYTSVNWPLNMYLYAPGMGTYMNTDLGSWKTGAHPAMGDIPVVWKFEGSVPHYTAVCSGLAGLDYKSGDGSSYDVVCSKDFGGNDIGVFKQPTFAACMDKCSTYNTQRGSAPKCLGVTFVPSVSDCWLKYTISRSAWVIGTVECDSAFLL